MAVVKRHPSSRIHVLAKFARRLLGPEGKHEVSKAPIGVARAGRPVGCVLRAPDGIGDMVLRGTRGDGVADRFVLRHVLGVNVACMQETEMRRVDVAFERLKVIALALNKRKPDLIFRNFEDFEGRQRWHLGARPHVDPDQPGALDSLVCPRFDLRAEVLVRQHVRHVDAISCDIVFPAVINAADSPFFVPAKK